MDDAPRPKPVRSCPICGKPVVVRYRPFCSQRCAMVDLGRWFGGSYSVPTEEKPGDSVSGGRADDDSDEA